MANGTNITLAGARAFAATDGREAVLWDSISTGLGLCARPSGRKMWIVHLRSNGWVVKRTLSAVDALTDEDARHVARSDFADVETGSATAASPTVRTLTPAFLPDCAERWKPATQSAQADGMSRSTQPAFGDRLVESPTAKDVRNWFDNLSVSRAGWPNQALAVLCR